MRLRRRLARRRRKQRYCLWGHHGHLVQIGSQTDRYLQRRLDREAELHRQLRQIRTAMLTFRASSIKVTDAMRDLAEACKAANVRVTSGYRPVVVPVKGDGGHLAPGSLPKLPQAAFNLERQPRR